MAFDTTIFKEIHDKLADIPIYEVLYSPIERVLYSKPFILRFDRPKSFPHESRRISVAITHYERPEFLVRTLKNIFHDQRVSEIVILDDGSSQDTFFKCVNILKDFSSKVRLFRREQNLGPFTTSIQVCSLCSNPWCVLLDSDNTIFKNYLNTIFSLNIWDERTIYCPDYAFPHYSFKAYSNYVFNFDDICHLHQSSKILIHNFLFSCLINGGNYFLNCKTFVMTLQPYMVLRPYATDSILRNYIWLSKDNNLSILKNAWYYHRVHAGSNWTLNAKQGIAEYHILAKKFEKNRRATLKNLLSSFRSSDMVNQNIERVSLHSATPSETGW
ncbi:glycosyltransferase family 2 protein [Leptolyngbya sp. FACHB-16]|uniref:glycosyltransferase family 2 protein n=1 Tax=unclassified Leptolyngbya TaxID=2650499 RepID=UPI00168245EC|nr:glycosyltransferase family 2 protein [Leptolyngbya sp. FACHB-16]MBD2158905.1 glycosyltransferase [Leptolyngbya sp. FACHB-16]